MTGFSKDWKEGPNLTIISRSKINSLAKIHEISTSRKNRCSASWIQQKEENISLPDLKKRQKAKKKKYLMAWKFRVSRENLLCRKPRPGSNMWNSEMIGQKFIVFLILIFGCDQTRSVLVVETVTLKYLLKAQYGKLKSLFLCYEIGLRIFNLSILVICCSY